MSRPYQKSRAQIENEARRKDRKGSVGLAFVIIILIGSALLFSRAVFSTVTTNNSSTTNVFGFNNTITTYKSLTNFTTTQTSAFMNRTSSILVLNNTFTSIILHTEGFYQFGALSPIQTYTVLFTANGVPIPLSVCPRLQLSTIAADKAPFSYTCIVTNHNLITYRVSSSTTVGDPLTTWNDINFIVTVAHFCSKCPLD